MMSVSRYIFQSNSKLNNTLIKYKNISKSSAEKGDLSFNKLTFSHWHVKVDLSEKHTLRLNYDYRIKKKLRHYNSSNENKIVQWYYPKL
jgi:hypothetical protein